MNVLLDIGKMVLVCGGLTVAIIFMFDRTCDMVAGPPDKVDEDPSKRELE